ncbi:MAG: energy-coupling factor transporter transmembrane protein EcfT [Corynebacterium sp.]|uniref:energy-coupling factor transporter transmembrane component T family protein n=1 Tax=Corynebacterium sp. TaxID=1720 RepID=UPI0026DC8EB5|nr:energy-coupling factor transporter transmembrane protein EcfT [Corynebacterium sp.]MDO5098045.1 energy-coupling factor transporter transmembrane protein EcfT [Corynebacterium sp.]
MMRSIPLGVYVASNSVIHRLPPLLKFCFLIVFIVGTSILISTPTAAVLSVVCVAGLYVLGKIPARIAFQQLWPPLPVLLALGAFQWWQSGIEKALVTVFVIFAAIMLAMLLTLTTTIDEMMEAMERALQPLARFGVPVDIIVLAFSLTMRLIPLMLATVYEVLDARKARGAAFSITAFGTPVLIRSIKRARNIADALMARGVGD